MTLGTLATELHRRGRSALLVSHTNAAVDQALLHVARAIGEDELARGLVLRLGESKDDRVLNTPDLLVQTHVERRSAELVAERGQLNGEQGEQLRQLAALDRLVEIAEWLRDAPGELDRARAQVAQHDQLEQQTAAVAERHAAAEAELAPWRALEPDARRSVEYAERLELLKQQLPGLGERAAAVGSELEQTRTRRVEAEAVAEEAAEHVPQVRAAQERVAQLRAELPQREPLLAATDQELDELAASVTEAETALTRAEEANALTRRLRGLPHPDQQRRTLESLRERRTRLEEARTQATEQLAVLNVEFQKAEQTIAEYGHLPDPEVAAQEAHALQADDERLRDDAIAASSELSKARSIGVARVELGDRSVETLGGEREQVRTRL
jgi:hypothetical protein